MVPGIQPTEQRSADAAEVQDAGGAGGKTGTDSHSIER
jgi:hypothetical protein